MHLRLKGSRHIPGIVQGWREDRTRIARSDRHSFAGRDSAPE